MTSRRDVMGGSGRRRPPAQVTGIRHEPRPLTLVTGNAGKLAEARRIADGWIEGAEVDLPEIQSLDYREVLEAKGEEAWRRLGDRRPLVVEEAGLDLAALGGFPGPLVKWMLEAMGAAGIAKAVAALGDPRATARCFLLYMDGERDVVAEGTVEGVLVPPRGDRGFGWDPVFLPEGSERTFGELEGAEKDAVSHRGRAWQALLTELGVTPS